MLEVETLKILEMTRGMLSWKWVTLISIIQRFIFSGFFLLCILGLFWVARIIIKWRQAKNITKK